MKNIFLILSIFALICPNVYALKAYSYDENGNRVYQQITSENKTLLPKGTKGVTYVYDKNNNKAGSIVRRENGYTYFYDSDRNKVGSYTKRPNGYTYVYDGNGNKVRSYKSRPNGYTYAYDGNGNKVRSWKTIKNN